MFRAPVGKEQNWSLFCGNNPIMMESLHVFMHAFHHIKKTQEE